MKKFNELQENWKRHFNKFKNKINEHKGTLKECPEITKQKYWSKKLNEWETMPLESTENIDQMEDRISKLNDQNLEMIQVEEERETLWNYETPLEKPA